MNATDLLVAIVIFGKHSGMDNPHLFDAQIGELIGPHKDSVELSEGEIELLDAHRWSVSKDHDCWRHYCAG